MPLKRTAASKRHDIYAMTMTMLNDSMYCNAMHCSDRNALRPQVRLGDVFMDAKLREWNTTAVDAASRLNAIDDFIPKVILICIHLISSNQITSISSLMSMSTDSSNNTSRAICAVLSRTRCFDIDVMQYESISSVSSLQSL